jgi:serine/threonine protein kinase
VILLNSLTFLLSLLLFSAPLQQDIDEQAHVKAVSSPELKEEIVKAFKTKDYESLGSYLKNTVHHNNELHLVKQLALEIGSQKLIRAVQFAFAFIQCKEKIDIKAGELLQIALYIQAKMPQFISQGEYYLTRTMTGLALPLEYDPETKKCFIILEGISGAYLGKGASKTVTKCILFNPAKPEILARLKPDRPKEPELMIMKLLRGSPGLISIRAITHRTKHNDTLWTAYTDVYKAGSLEPVLRMEYRFTLQEKLKIALDLLTGLTSLHSKNIVHRDIKTANCLIDIVPLAHGKRKVSAVIADFGCAAKTANAVSLHPNIAGTNTSPEAFLTSKMKGADFLHSDVFATGCILYKLYYRKYHPWKYCKFFKKDIFTSQEKHKLLISKINKTTKAKRELLAKKKAKNDLTPGQEFEYLILRMLNPNPEKRGKAADLKNELLEIYNKNLVRTKK